MHKNKMAGTQLRASGTGTDILLGIDDYYRYTIETKLTAYNSQILLRRSVLLISVVSSLSARFSEGKATFVAEDNTLHDSRK
jgi:hypothetical protein